MLRPSPNHGTQRLPNDDDIHVVTIYLSFTCMYSNSQPHNGFCTFYETVFGIIYKASKIMGNTLSLHNFRDTV